MNLLKRLSLLASLCVTLCFTLAARAQVKPSALFSDHMVLQSGTLVPIWGTATPGEKVAVTLNGQTRSATADAQGKWTVSLYNLKPGGPFEMTIAGDRAGDAPIVVKDVLVGEVWLGSGQSNMQFNVSAKGHPPYGLHQRGQGDRRRKLSATAHVHRQERHRVRSAVRSRRHMAGLHSADRARLVRRRLSLRARSQPGAQIAGRHRALGLRGQHRRGVDSARCDGRRPAAEAHARQARRPRELLQGPPKRGQRRRRASVAADHQRPPRPPRPAARSCARPAPAHRAL